MRPNRLKNLCKAGVVVLGSIVGAGHTTGLIVQATTDNPADFLQKNLKQKINENAIKPMTDNNHVRVVQYGSWQMNLYRWTHPFFMIAQNLGLKGNTAYIPTAFLRVLGEKELLLARSPHAQTMMERVFGRPYSGERDMQFAYTITHEAGHHDHHRRVGDAFFTTTFNKREAIADLFAIKSLHPVYGDKINRLVTSFRATHLTDNEHDVLPALLHQPLPNTPLDDTAELTKTKVAVDSYNEVAEYISRECFDKKGITYANIPQVDLYKAYYTCLKPQERHFIAAAKANPINAQMRISQFIQGYEYLQQLENK